MNGHGGPRPGGGRKTNAQKLIEAGFVANWYTADFQETKWKSLVNSEDENIRLRAMMYLTDRIHGKAAQPVTGEGGQGPIQFVVRSILGAPKEA